jgi:hypothetical protein
MDKPSSIPVISISLEERYEIPGILVVEPTGKRLSLKVFRDEIVVGFEAEVPILTICDGEYLGSFTWGSSRITYWRIRGGDHTCFPYNGNTSIACNNIPVFYIHRDFRNKVSENICRLLEYIELLTGNTGLIIVESNESHPRIQNNILILGRITSEEEVAGLIGDLLRSKGIRESFIGGLINILRICVIEKDLFKEIITSLINRKYIVNNGIILVEAKNGLYIGFKTGDSG